MGLESRYMELLAKEEEGSQNLLINNRIKICINLMKIDEREKFYEL